MSQVYCTLYNSNYLDKGLVLYDSLCECAKDFKLYVLCMDDKCYEVLNDLHLEHHIPIKLSDFEENDVELLRAKENRTFGEYCWTCTPGIILYVMNTYKEDICTYLDVDMYFYKDPIILIDEMEKTGKSVMVVPHRFTKENKHLEKNGRFCVEFNTFRNNPESIKILIKWKNDCIDCCSSINDGKRFGDQKYLDEWPELYPDVVHICHNEGAGTAPWNIGWYKKEDSYNHVVRYKKDNSLVPIVFHHFAGVAYISRYQIRTGVIANIDTIDYEFVEELYVEYLNKLEDKKKLLEKEYDIDLLLKAHPAYNNLNKWQRLLRNLSFLYRVKYLIHPPQITIFIVNLK